MNVEHEHKCPFCDSVAEVEANHRNNSIFYICPTCGRYILEIPSYNEVMKMKNEVAAYLYYNGNPNFLTHSNKNRYFAFSVNRRNIDYDNDQYTGRREVSIEEIRNFYPKTFADRIARILLGFAKRSNFFGDVVRFSRNELYSALFVKRFDEGTEELKDSQIKQQFSSIKDYLQDNNKYANISYGDSPSVLLMPEGWKRIEELQLDDNNNKKVFISMAFNDGTVDTREAIKAGIIEAGYSPELIDEIIHNKQIVPEMFRLIRESRFLILDITDPNYGAYYEAGYALGLGKEVIICCSKEVFTKEYQSEEEKKYAKYLKPHFDIAQKQILVWENYDDLMLKLSEWIKAIVG